ncbi:hypothetical protein [Lysinibacillus contaminans]|nr:hypothetical protein [Lysinibacillus contaminans]
MISSYILVIPLIWILTTPIFSFKKLEEEQNVFKLQSVLHYPVCS